ncbi:PilN domain-containing protein [Sporolactobacillus kofuensis]|uniref:PilN domain-containing protein n=1 Tax=Sporolactobacillus kofuensis TaxID=269672 RepID=A0ABW1WD28_9BACL|nr:hypothetical protein [Sporolactobacillus kofuensis]MCO7175615.1 hypothetical protein [Sporolactobacillus kofuensis]
MIDINLLPYEQKTSPKMILFIIAFAIFCLAGLITLAVYNWHLNSELQSVQKQEAAWKARANKTIEFKQPEVSTKPTPADAVNEILLNRLTLFTTWAEMTKELPTSGSFTTIDYDTTGKMTVTADVPSFADIRPYIDRLRKQRYFSKVVVTQVNQIDPSSGSSIDQTKGYQLTFTMHTAASLPITKKKD